MPILYQKSSSTPDDPSVPSAPHRRIPEIDIARGIAIVLMVLFHLVFDLRAYMGMPIHISSGFWFSIGRSSAILFMLVSGISSTLGKPSFRRSYILLGSAMVITLVSIPIMGEQYIRFGILHFFAAMTLLKTLLELLIPHFRTKMVLFTLMIPLSFGMGQVVSNIQIPTPLLLPFGVTHPGFSSFDYYPIFPWAGFFFLGVVFGYFLYSDRKYSANRPRNRSVSYASRSLARIGQYSLPIYMLHQPILLALLLILSAIGLLPPMNIT